VTMATLRFVLLSVIILSVVCADFSARFIPSSAYWGRLGQLTALCSWLELRVAAVLRPAGPVVQLGPVVAAVDDRGGGVVGIHGCIDEDHRVVRRAEGVLQG
jgi:hypothetical protein